MGEWEYGSMGVWECGSKGPEYQAGLRGATKSWLSISVNYAFTNRRSNRQCAFLTYHLFGRKRSVIL